MAGVERVLLFPGVLQCIPESAGSRTGDPGGEDRVITPSLLRASVSHVHLGVICVKYTSSVFTPGLSSLQVCVLDLKGCRFGAYIV